MKSSKDELTKAIAKLNAITVRNWKSGKLILFGNKRAIEALIGKKEKEVWRGSIRGLESKP